MKTRRAYSSAPAAKPILNLHLYESVIAEVADALAIVRDMTDLNSAGLIDGALKGELAYELLCSFSDECELKKPFGVYRLNGRPHDLQIDFQGMGWTCGPASGLGVTSALASLTGQSESELCGVAFELIAKALLLNVLGERDFAEISAEKSRALGQSIQGRRK